MGWPKSEHMSCQQIQDIIANPHHNCSTTVQWTSIPVEAVRNTPHHRPQTLPLVFQISFWQVNVYLIFFKKKLNSMRICRNVWEKKLARVCHCMSHLFQNSPICRSIKQWWVSWAVVHCLTLFHGIKSTVLLLAHLFTYSAEF